MDDLYNMIFKRKSFRDYNAGLTLSEEDLRNIFQKIQGLVPLVNNIKVDCSIVPREETSSRRGEYCLLIYSEEKEHCLLNIGYMFEQLDLHLASMNIGACWYGLGKTKEPRYRDLPFVIMMTLGKATEGEFRKDYRKSKRRETGDIWKGDLSREIGDVVKFAPSACNSQPWRVICENSVLKVFRDPKIRSIIPVWKIPFYNSVDMGIFLCFLELALSHNEQSFTKALSPENKAPGLAPIAVYHLGESGNVLG